MNVGKLKRVAIKEFTRSPVKSAVLLALFPVALYVCVPLLMGGVKKSLASSTATTVGKVPLNAGFVLPHPPRGVEAMNDRGQGQGWMEVARRLDDDLLSAPVGIPPDTRNPFAAIHQTAELLASVQQEDEQPSAEALPEAVVKPGTGPGNPIRDLGLQLSATIVGQHARLATINGKTYEEGEVISIMNDAVRTAQGITMQLRLSSVDRRFVELEMEGYRHRLQLRNELPEDAIVVKSRLE